MTSLPQTRVDGDRRPANGLPGSDWPVLEHRASASKARTGGCSHDLPGAPVLLRVQRQLQELADRVDRVTNGPIALFFERERADARSGAAATPWRRGNITMTRIFSDRAAVVAIAIRQIIATRSIRPKGCRLFARAPDWLYELILRKPEPAPQPKPDGKHGSGARSTTSPFRTSALGCRTFRRAAEYQPDDPSEYLRKLSGAISKRICRSARRASRTGASGTLATRQGKRTAIDIVIEYGRKRDAAEAALWLCERAASIRRHLAGASEAPARDHRHSRGAGARQRHHHAGRHRSGLRPPLRRPAALLPPHRRLVRMDRHALEEGRDSPGVPVLPRTGTRVHRRLQGRAN